MILFTDNKCLTLQICFLSNYYIPFDITGGEKGANLKSVNQTKQTKNPPTLLILMGYLVYLEQSYSSSFAMKYGENI